MPSVSIINADADGTVSTDTIEVDAYRTEGAVRSKLGLGGLVVTDSQGNPMPHYLVEYRVDNGAWTECDFWNESSTVGQQMLYLSKYGVPSATVKTATEGVAFRLKHSGNTNTVLKETAPIRVVKDGANAPYNVYAYARYDSRAANATTGAPTGTIDPNVGWVSVAPAPSETYPYIWQRIQHYSGDDELQNTSYICLTGAPGSTGARGSTGRFYYYAEVYNANNTYQIEETQAQYVKHGGKFWMLDNGGTEPSSLPWPSNGKPGTPGVASAWTEMSSEHQYYIARAFFGENAYLGSFIINDDWMISQYGTYKPDANTTIVINGNNISAYPSAYTNFKPADPLATGSAGYPCFAPNFAVDGKTGKTYQQNAVVRGTIDAKLLFIKPKVLKPTASGGSLLEYNIDPINEPYSSFIADASENNIANVKINLPHAADYDGIEFSFFALPINAPSMDWQGQMWIYPPSATEKMIFYSEGDNKFYETLALRTKGFELKVKSISGFWVWFGGSAEPMGKYPIE